MRKPRSTMLGVGPASCTIAAVMLLGSRWLQLALLWLVCALVSLPALRGSWVYDDLVTAHSAQQDGWDDLAAVFSRDSADYLGSTGWSSGVTYRPLSMASLIVVQAIDPELPWLHHLISLALHLGCTLALYRTCVRLRSATSQLPLWLAGLFALHPVGIESYGWINGRSDVLAGLLSMLVSCGLPWDGERSRLRDVGLGLAACGAALSKEPALVVVSALLAACALPRPDERLAVHLRRVWPSVLAGAAGLLVALVARLWVTRAHASGASALLQDAQLVPRFAQLLSLSVEHLLVPIPRAMTSLVFALSNPVRALDWLLLAVSGAGALALLRTRQLRALVLLLGALVSLVPVLPVTQMMWLGLDRYLYLPLLLALLAVAELVPTGRLDLRYRQVAFAMLPLLGLSTMLTARFYESHPVWLQALLETQPDDASGNILAARYFLKAGDAGRARAMLLRAPQERLPPALSHELIALLHATNEPRAAMRIADGAVARYPDDGFAVYDAMAADAMRGRFEAARVKAGELARRFPVQCPPAREALQTWLRGPDLSPAAKRELETVIAQLHCQPR